MPGEDIHNYFKREYMCISTVGITPGWETNETESGELWEIPETVAPNACWEEFVNQTSEHNVVYLGNDTACLLNLPKDLRMATLQRMIDKFTDNPINCHVQFAYDDTASNILSMALTFLIFVSMFCLVLTIVIYAIKGELCSIPGLNLACLSFSHFVHYLTGVLNLFNFPHYMVSNEACSLFGFMRNFTILATFFWLNVMAFDIWRTIASMEVNNTGRNTKKLVKWKRFLKYSIYAWGMPLLIAVWALIFDNIPGMPESWRPNYRRPYLLDPDVRCAMSGNNLGSLLLFNTLPRLSVLLANCVFFFLTARNIHQTSSQVTRSTRSMKCQRNRFRLYVKLFIVMGLAWSLNITDYIIHLHYGVDWVWSGPQWFKMIVDYVTCFIGVAIFITFGLQPAISLTAEKCCIHIPFIKHAAIFKKKAIRKSVADSLSNYPQPKTEKTFSATSA